MARFLSCSTILLSFLLFVQNVVGQDVNWTSCPTEAVMGQSYNLTWNGSVGDVS
ncbi:hypothetical protein ES702_05396 [subsurface metagenome]